MICQTCAVFILLLSVRIKRGLAENASCAVVKSLGFVQFLYWLNVARHEKRGRHICYNFLFFFSLSTTELAKLSGLSVKKARVRAYYYSFQLRVFVFVMFYQAKKLGRWIRPISHRFLRPKNTACLRFKTSTNFV